MSHWLVHARGFDADKRPCFLSFWGGGVSSSLTLLCLSTSSCFINMVSDAERAWHQQTGLKWELLSFQFFGFRHFNFGVPPVSPKKWSSSLPALMVLAYPPSRIVMAMSANSVDCLPLPSSREPLPAVNMIEECLGLSCWLSFDFFPSLLGQIFVIFVHSLSCWRSFITSRMWYHCVWGFSAQNHTRLIIHLNFIVPPV